MKQQPSTITSLPASPDDERRSRMIKYTVTMSVRVLCVVAMLFARGWWLWVFAAGAIFLPYIAVVVANVKSNPGKRTILRPGALLPTHQSPPGTAPSDTSPSDTHEDQK
jgi:hypothetical protein